MLWKENVSGRITVGLVDDFVYYLLFALKDNKDGDIMKLKAAFFKLAMNNIRLVRK